MGATKSSPSGGCNRTIVSTSYLLRQSVNSSCGPAHEGSCVLSRMPSPKPVELLSVRPLFVPALVAQIEEHQEILLQHAANALGGEVLQNPLTAYRRVDSVDIVGGPNELLHRST